MALNRLYQLILDDKPDFITADQLAFKRSAKEGTPFALIELPIPREVSISEDDNDYVLDSHHLSFYEKIDSRNHCLSEYHHTAIFKDKNNNQYQSHVYFNQKDQLTTSPHFNSIEKDQYTPQIISKKFSDMLSQLAQTYSENYLKRIREHHVNKVEKLREDYHASENQLDKLSENEELNRDQYLQQLDVTINKLNNVIKYCANPSYQATLSLLERIKTILLSDNSPLQLPETSDDEIIAAPSISPILLPVIPTKSAAKPNAKSLIENVKKSQSVFNVEGINEFTNYYNSINEILALIDSNECIGSASDLRAIQKLNTDATKQGVSLLKEALRKKDFDSAKKLSKFTPALPDLTTKAAIATNNAPLLRFLLTHGDIAINTFVVNDQLTPVAFCFQNSTEKSTKKEVFDVLLEFGANVMTEAKDGLPVAYHLIKVKGHPLSVSLADLLIQPNFWRILVTMLRSRVANHPELNDRITEYENLAKQKAADLPRIASFNTKQILQHEVTIAKTFTAEQKADLQDDPEVRRNKDQITMLSTQFVNMLDAKQQLAMGLMVKANMNDIEKNFVNYGVEKDAVIAIQQKQIERLHNQIKLAMVANRLKKGHKNARSLNLDLKIQKELVAEIEKISEQINKIEEMNYDIQQAKEGWIVIRTQADIDKIRSKNKEKAAAKQESSETLSQPNDRPSTSSLSQ